MNTGKICVSVCAETADEAVAKLFRVPPSADLIEVRFDCLRGEELENLKSRISNLKCEIPLIATYRSPEQGGRNAATPDERKAFWHGLSDAFWAADLEEDIFGDVSTNAKRIVSFHDLNGCPHDLNSTYQRLAALEPDLIKIAVTTTDAADAISVWKLLENTCDGIVPVAMGEAGKWTRILGLAHGVSLTYCSLEEGDETAPGQLTVGDLVNVYRVKDLDTSTKVYGVIGNPVSESLSPYIHNAAFAEAGLNAVFIPLLVKDLDTFMRRMVLTKTREVELNFAGFAVTMPHKREIKRHLDSIDPAAKQIGAVNTVKIEGGGLTGYNTDAEGFITPLKHRFPDLTGVRVAILGAGGAARACVYALKQDGAEVTVVARDEEKLNALAGEFDVSSLAISNFRSEISNHPQGFDVLVNATPMGMKGRHETETPVTADELKSVKLVYDLVTSQTDTPLIREAKMAGVPTISGLEMLIGQGASQFELWTGLPAPVERMRDAAIFRMSKKANV